METNEFRVICETDDNLYVEIFFNGESATVIFDKKTGEWEVEGDGYARILGYKDMQDMMSDDAVLDGVNQMLKEGINPFSKSKFPLFIKH